MTNGQAKQKLETDPDSKVELCEYHENLYNIEVEDYLPKGVYSFERLIKYCEERRTVSIFYCSSYDFALQYHYLFLPLSTGSKDC